MTKDTALECALARMPDDDSEVLRRTVIYPGVEQIEYADGRILIRGIGVPRNNGTYRIGAVSEGLAPIPPGAVVERVEPEDGG